MRNEFLSLPTPSKREHQQADVVGGLMQVALTETAVAVMFMAGPAGWDPDRSVSPTTNLAPNGKESRTGETAPSARHLYKHGNLISIPLVRYSNRSL